MLILRTQIGFVLFFAALWCLRVSAVAAKPNIIVIFSDDHGWADLGAQGIQKDIRTPNLDALASGGLRAANGYVTAPQCVPSRAGLLSGRYQPRFGVESNGDTLEGFDAQLTIAERLKKAGYATGMTGKWHLGPPDKIIEHGFDDVFYQGGNWTNFDLEGRDTVPGTSDTTLYHLDANSAAACAFIERHKDEPFFFYLAYRAPHTPLDAPPKYTSRFPGEMPERRRQALAMISAIDDGVGRVMATLREHGLEENTLLFFMGDNGAPLKIHKIDSPVDRDAGGWDGSLNAPMNGEKGMLSEGGIRVPWLAYWAGTIPGGQVYEHPVISLDVAATAVALAGLPTDPVLDGVNLIPHFIGQDTAAPHETLYWRWIAQSAIREGQWKLLAGGARSYLYNLDADPSERNNLISQHPEIAERLRARLDAWSGELQPPGIAIKPMAPAWENYFDFYLDGKDASAPEAGAGRRSSGWIVRNAGAELKDGALHITPEFEGKQRPFLAFANLKISGPAAVSVTIRSEKGGRSGFAWRLDGQNDFLPDQSVAFDLPGSVDWQEKTIELPAAGRIIHLRVLLPAEEADLRRVEIKAERGGPAKVWEFGAK